MSVRLVIQESPPSSTEGPARIVEDGTFHEDLIAFLAARLKVQSYLELGVAQNETLQKVRRVCTGRMFAVDKVEPARKIPMVHYFIKSTEQFFAVDAAGYAPYDFVFIDADHRYESVKADFVAVWPHVTEQGLVVLHDTWPKDKEATDPGFCGDSWRFVDWLKGHSIESVTLPFHPGLTLVRKAAKHLPWRPD